MKALLDAMSEFQQSAKPEHFDQAWHHDLRLAEHLFSKFANECHYNLLLFWRELDLGNQYIFSDYLRFNMAHLLQVRIEVYGGVASVEDAPEFVDVFINDYDIGADEEED